MARNNLASVNTAAGLVEDWNPNVDNNVATLYNTTAPGIILVVNKHKQRSGEIMLINGSRECSKGKPKNYLADEHIARLSDAYLRWEEIEKLSRVVRTDEAVRNDYNLSPSRYVTVNGAEEVLPLEEAVVLLAEAEEERIDADRQLKVALTALGF